MKSQINNISYRLKRWKAKTSYTFDKINNLGINLPLVGSLVLGKNIQIHIRKLHDDYKDSWFEKGQHYVLNKFEKLLNIRGVQCSRDLSNIDDTFKILPGLDMMCCTCFNNRFMKKRTHEVDGGCGFNVKTMYKEAKKYIKNKLLYKNLRRNPFEICTMKIGKTVAKIINCKNTNL